MTPPVQLSRLVFWLVAVAALLVPLNSTMVAVALPTLVDAFDSSIGSVTLIVTAYLAAMAVVQPLAGRAGDRFGRRRLLLAGLIWFGIASAGAATASSLPLLIAWRVQQAIAGALTLPNAIGLLREVAPPETLGRRMGTVMGALPLGAAAGPPLGGILLVASGWQAIFLVNLPIILVVVPLAWRALPTAVPDHHEAHARVSTLLRKPAFLAPTGAIALSNMAMYVTLIVMPLLLAARADASAAGTGAILGAAFLTAVALSPVGGHLADRAGRRLPAVIGVAVQASAIALLAISPANMSLPALLAALVAMGAGVGLSAAPIQVAALEAVSARAAGVASGVYSTSRYLGSITGMLLLAGPLALGPGTQGYALALVAMAIAAAGALVLAVLLPGAKARRAAAEEVQEPAAVAA